MMRPHLSRQQIAVGRLAATLRHLRWKQVVWRGWYFAAGPVIRRVAAWPQPGFRRRPWSDRLASPSYLPPRQTSLGSFTVVGETGRIDAPADWNARDRSKLWLFNVHYLDDLANETIADSDRAALFDTWISGNPPARGIGWHPYPTSLRLVNAIKFASRRYDSPARWLESVAIQARALDWQVEHQIGANHVLANAKALVFAGAFLDGEQADRRLAHGLRLLDDELAEQFLSDGGHYERSPMYHAIALWDLCDLLDLARATGLPALAARTARWRALLSYGLDWLEAMTHPDGDIAFFNDAALGIAPSLAEITSYSADVSCPRASPARSFPHVEHLTESGYVVVEFAPDTKAILDIAPIGPAHQPGHTHADTLSFELSVGGRRVIVNSGTSTYSVGPERHRQRSTAAHSTVALDGLNSSDVWKSFRVGRRARPFDTRIERDSAAITVTASHDGYAHLPGRPIHTRRWRLEPRRLLVTDTISGQCESAVARYHLHPDATIEADKFGLPGQGSVSWQAFGTSARVVAGTWHPEFGVSQSNVCVELPVAVGGATLELAW